MVLDNLLEGCQVIGPDFRYLYANESVAAHGRTTRERLLGRTMTEAYPGIEDTEMFAVLRQCMEDRKPRQMENEFTFPDGSKGWFELRFEPAEEGVVVLSMDITERKNAEAALQRSNRALAALSRCNQTLVRAKDERRFMEDVCRVVVETGGYRLAWIGMKDGGDTRSVRPVARAGVDDGYVDQAEVTWDESERGAGPVGRAIRTGQPVAARFIATDPEFEPWREDAFARGLASCLALPIRDNGEVLGALAIYAAEPDAFDDAERKLLTEMALDLGYGITTLRSRVARREVEGRVEHLNAFLRGIRNVNQLITRERDPQALIEQACGLLVESRGFSTSCIVLCDGERIVASADAGAEPKLRAELLSHLPDHGRTGGQLHDEVGGVRTPVLPSRRHSPCWQRDTGGARDRRPELRTPESIGRLAGGVAHDFNNLLSVIISYAGFAADALRESDPIHADIVGRADWLSPRGSRGDRGRADRSPRSPWR